MKTIYQVIHEYDVLDEFDEVYGFEAIPEGEVIATFENEEDANTFAKKYTNEHIYQNPHCPLYCGRLTVSEVKVLSSLSDFNADDEKYFWWLNKEDK